MITYSLSSNPNFTISCIPEGITYEMTFRYIRGLMYVTIADASGNRIAGPVRICEGQWLIPHRAYNFPGAGNFLVVEQHKQYPLFENFDSTCELRYYSLDEIQEGVSLDE